MNQIRPEEIEISHCDRRITSDGLVIIKAQRFRSVDKNRELGAVIAVDRNTESRVMGNAKAVESVGGSQPQPRA